LNDRERVVLAVAPVAPTGHFSPPILHPPDRGDDADQGQQAQDQAQVRNEGEKQAVGDGTGRLPRIDASRQWHEQKGLGGDQPIHARIHERMLILDFAANVAIDLIALGFPSDLVCHAPLIRAHRRSDIRNRRVL
jgi:hypothetical protein